MKITRFENEEEWLEFRNGKITGTRVKDVIVKRNTGEEKMGFYELIAERLALPPDDENVMERGKRLESEAIKEFTETTGKEVITDLVVWTRDENERIALSPDGYVEDLTEAVEVKCLASANHIKSYLTKQIPSEYEDQAMQYFVVNDKLEQLHFAFYDPRLLVANFFIITLDRSNYTEKIKDYYTKQINLLDRVEAVVKSLTF